MEVTQSAESTFFFLHEGSGTKHAVAAAREIYSISEIRRLSLHL